MPNLGAAIWRTILNIKLLCFPRCVLNYCYHVYQNLLNFTYAFNVTIKNVSWPHFSWPTLYLFIPNPNFFLRHLKTHFFNLYSTTFTDKPSFSATCVLRCTYVLSYLSETSALRSRRRQCLRETMDDHVVDRCPTR